METFGREGIEAHAPGMAQLEEVTESPNKLLELITLQKF